jgi:hypothetical protein
MSVLILSWSIITGFKFWMIEPAFAPVGQAEIRVFIVFIFLFLSRLPLSRLTDLLRRLLGSDSPGSRQRG